METRRFSPEAVRAALGLPVNVEVVGVTWNAGAGTVDVAVRERRTLRVSGSHISSERCSTSRPGELDPLTAA